MLDELEIRNLGPIRAANVAFAPGMTTITGETGTGKSMLLNALKLVRGAQAESAKVSAGAEGTWVQAIFDISPDSSAARAADDAGVLSEGDGKDRLFLARQVPARGRSKAIVNGRTVPSGLLKQIADDLVTIHGQADQMRLVSSARQRELLDEYMCSADSLKRYSKAWKRLVDADRTLRDLESQQADVRQRADYLRDSLEQIARVDPQPHEDEDLRDRRARAENAAAIIRAVTGALRSLDPSTGDFSDGAVDGVSSVASLLADAQNALRPAMSIPQIAQCLSRLENVSAAVSDAVCLLEEQLRDDDVSDADLDRLNERIHDLTGLTRRWGPSVDDVLAWRDKAAAELNGVDASPEKLDALRTQRAQAYEEALGLAHELHQRRVAAASDLASQVNGELASLAMAGARLEIDVEARREADHPLDAFGMDDVLFLFSAFPGAPCQPVAKSASGGELSRLMLALEVCLARRLDGAGSAGPADNGSSGSDDANARRRTFVFDEIDAGVGGQTAVELGKRLARLARREQVIVVTHLPQVASWADAQIVVSKGPAGANRSNDDGPNAAASDEAAVTTTVTPVSGEAREEEIARMLSGTVSAVSLEHARQLLRDSTLHDDAPNNNVPRDSAYGTVLQDDAAAALSSGSNAMRTPSPRKTGAKKTATRKSVTKKKPTRGKQHEGGHR